LKNYRGGRNEGEGKGGKGNGKNERGLNAENKRMMFLTEGTAIF